MSARGVGLLPTHYTRSSNGVNGLTPTSSSRSILRIREKYLLVLVIVIFIVFSVVGVAYLPELKASNVYKYIKPADNLGPDLLGLVPPIDSHIAGGDGSHTARARFEDKQRLKMKINEEFSYNMSQIRAVLPKPNVNGLGPQMTLNNDD